MRVAVDDRIAARERGDQTLSPPHSRPGNMDDPEPRALDLHDPSLGQGFSQRGLVHVPDDALDRSESPELLEHRNRREVTRVQDQVRLLEPAQAIRGQPPRSSRQVRIRNDGNQGQLIAPSRKRPSR
jgi:hypothetical protein